MTTDYTFKERYDELKGNKDREDKLFQDMLAEIERLKEAIKEKAHENERERAVSTIFHNAKEDLGEKLVKIQTDMESNPYVLVLIDGDAMNFKEQFMQNSMEGGQNAASLLINSLWDYLQREFPDLHRDTAITVRIYANMKGLASLYRDEKFITDSSGLEHFVRGFNKHALLDFVDAGSGKECADEKIRQLFKLNIKNVHCKHIVFGGSSDNGYARMLDPYADDKTTSQRITLLEGPPFAQELEKLCDKFKKTSFPELFCEKKLERRRVSFESRPTTPTRGSRTSHLATPAQSSYASAVATQWTGNTVLPASPPPKKTIPKNSKGQRVDPALHFTQADFMRLKELKLCNSHFILSNCPYGDDCRHSHNQKLSADEIEALRSIARQRACNNGLSCEESTCLSGHACPYRPCRDGDACRFSKEMHGVDSVIVNV